MRECPEGPKSCQQEVRQSNREQRVTTHSRSCTKKHVKGLTSLIPPRVLHAKASSRGPPSKLRLFRSAGISTARAAVRAGGGAAANAGSQDNGNGKLFLPQLNRLQEEKKRSEVPPLASSWTLPALRTSSPIVPTPLQVSSDAAASYSAIEQVLSPIESTQRMGIWP